MTDPTPHLLREMSTADFRNNLTETVREVRETGRPVRLTSYGKPRAVLISSEEYDRLLRDSTRLAVLDARDSKKAAMAAAYGASPEMVEDIIRTNLGPPLVQPGRTDATAEFFRHRELEDQPTLTTDEVFDGRGETVYYTRDGRRVPVETTVAYTPADIRATGRMLGIDPSTHTRGTAIDFEMVAVKAPTKEELKEMLLEALKETGLSEEDARTATERTFVSTKEDKEIPAPTAEIPSWAVLLDRHIESDRIYPEPPPPPD